VRDPNQDAPAVDLEPRDQSHDSTLTSRLSASLTGLDGFWPILAVVLVVAVTFVASVAHSSMESVGVAVSRNELATPTPSSTAGAPLLIVQISSHTTRSAAQAASQELIDRGFNARILRSDNYRPLNPGYFVVFTGPYEPTAAGRAAAKRVAVQIQGALVRDVRRS
jgi:hypothetical protein